MVDVLGLIWGLLITGANTSDRDGGIRMLLTIKGRTPRLTRIWADRGYRGQFIDWVKDLCG